MLNTIQLHLKDVAKEIEDCNLKGEDLVAKLSLVLNDLGVAVYEDPDNEEYDPFIFSED